MNDSLCSWDRTIVMRQRLEDKIENDTYLGRPIIHRDTPIDGGVYLGSSQREAIVVDSKKYPMLNVLYNVAKEMCNVNGKFRKELVLSAVYHTVKDAMPYRDESKIRAIVRALNAEKDGKIALDVFIAERVGNCTHKALACAALLEMFKKAGLISGKVSVDRNMLDANGYGHAWCRYTNSCGEVYILDVQQDYIGSLDNALKLKKWPYARPEEAV